MSKLPLLARTFAYLSILTVGGGMAAFPELKKLSVDVHHWLTFPQLIHFYSVGQMAPGPNMMMVTAIGEWVAGLPGALVVLVAYFLPTALLTFVAGRIWNRVEGWPWRPSIQHGLAPVSIGLLLSGLITLAEGALSGWVAIAIAASVFATLLRSKINPALLVLAGAMVGLVAFGPSSASLP
ncbi:MAG: chromate transporter [Myxococcaceae bacterium]